MLFKNNTLFCKKAWPWAWVALYVDCPSYAEMIHLLTHYIAYLHLSPYSGNSCPLLLTFCISLIILLARVERIKSSKLINPLLHRYDLIALNLLGYFCLIKKQTMYILIRWMNQPIWIYTVITWNKTGIYRGKG